MPDQSRIILRRGSGHVSPELPLMALVSFNTSPNHLPRPTTMTKPAKTALISGIICTAFTAFITTCFGFSSDTPPPPAKSKEVELAELRKADSIYSAAKYAAAYRLDSMVDN